MTAPTTPWTEDCEIVHGHRIGDVYERIRVTRTLPLDGLSPADAATLLAQAGQGLTEAIVEVADEGYDCCGSAPVVRVVGYVPEESS